jgi:hypothetical protein
VKLLDSLCALIEPGFRTPPVAACLHCASIFSVTELCAQSLGPALSVPKERGDACQENHDESTD